jgi:predicted transcriptional regulator
MTKQIAVHLPDDLHARIVKAAEQDKRSVHMEMQWLMERGLAEREVAFKSQQDSR